MLGTYFLGLEACGAFAQGPHIPSGTTEAPGSNRPGAFGVSPGAPGGPGRSPGSEGGILGTRPGPSVPRVPTSIFDPSRRQVAAPPPVEVPRVPAVSPTPVPAVGILRDPAACDPHEPPASLVLSLDQAIETVVSDNPRLQVLASEIPQAQADILTAGLRNNPILYGDSQGIPYGRYQKGREGAVQYDLNVTYPLDVSGKRKARVHTAVQAERIAEALYQDAVRKVLDNLYTVYVDLLVARQSVCYYETSRQGLQAVRDDAETKLKERVPGVDRDDVRRVRIDLAEVQIGLRKAQADLSDARERLGGLLGKPVFGGDSITIQGELIRSSQVPPAPASELAQMALQCRPDVVAYRLGVQRADAESRLARANRFEDVYLLYQPYTFRTRAPSEIFSTNAWAIGLTVPVPLYNRNQGNILRTQFNMHQSRAELAVLEREVALEVEQAAGEVELSGQAVDDYQSTVMVLARESLDSSEATFRSSGGYVRLLEARGRYNEIFRRYLDVLIRHQRSLFALNTAVGQRLLFETPRRQAPTAVPAPGTRAVPMSSHVGEVIPIPAGLPSEGAGHHAIRQALGRTDH